MKKSVSFDYIILSYGKNLDNMHFSPSNLDGKDFSNPPFSKIMHAKY